MTVGGWILFGFIALLFIVFAGVIAINSNNIWVGITFGAVTIVAALAGMLFYYNGTAAGGRAFKSQESNFNKGIERVVKVYDVEGKLIQEYEGKFDIEYDDDRIVFDDENNKRHIIYYPTGTVIVDEV